MPPFNPTAQPALMENQALTSNPHPNALASDPDRQIHGTALRINIEDDPNAVYADAATTGPVTDPNAELRSKVAALRAAKEAKTLQAELDELSVEDKGMSEDTEEAKLEAELKTLEADGTETYAKEGD